MTQTELARFVCYSFVLIGSMFIFFHFPNYYSSSSVYHFSLSLLGMQPVETLFLIYELAENGALSDHLHNPSIKVENGKELFDGEAAGIVSHYINLVAYLAEFISTFHFVFAGVGSAIAYAKLTSDAALDPSGLVGVAVCHAFALFVAVSIAANISGGHVNPAVTFGLALGGQITVLTGIFYWIAQLVGSIVACYLLKFVTGGLAIPVHGVGAGVGAFQGVVMEIIITFALVYTVYATAADPKKGSLGTIAPIAIGFIVGANILAAAPFSGGSMNPARSFGPAVASLDFTNIWIYWVGPLIGGGLAGLIYANSFMCHEHAPLSSDY